MRARGFLSLRGALAAALVLLLLALVGLIAALAAAAPAPADRAPPAQAAASPAPSAAGADPDRTPQPDAPLPRGVTVRIPPRPPPPRLQALQLTPLDAVHGAELRAFLTSADRLIAALDPAVGYVSVLAAQALRGETSRLRVIVESGAMAGALARAAPARASPRLPADAQSLALLLLSILRTSLVVQDSVLLTLTGQQAVTERLQLAVEDRALRRLLEIHRALTISADLRNEVALAASGSVPRPP